MKGAYSQPGLLWRALKGVAHPSGRRFNLRGKEINDETNLDESDLGRAGIRSGRPIIHFRDGAGAAVSGRDALYSSGVGRPEERHRGDILSLSCGGIVLRDAGVQQDCDGNYHTDLYRFEFNNRELLLWSYG